MTDVEGAKQKDGYPELSASERPFKFLLRVTLLVGLTVSIIAAAGFWLWDTDRFVRTDNAYVQADIVPVGAQVSGRIGAILTAENRQVAAGQKLALIDPTDSQIALDRSRAEVIAQQAAARTGETMIAMQRANLVERQASLTAAEAELIRADAAHSRLNELFDQGWVTQQAVETAQAEARKARAALLQTRAAIAVGERSVEAVIAAKAEAVAKVEVASRTLQRFNRDLSLTAVRAPSSGIIADLSARIGQRLEAGVPLMYVVPDRGRYIVANFKETQIDRIRAGQIVTIEADALGGRSFRGIVDGLSPATGSQFAMIPVNTASGTFTRVVQRVPVRIKLANESDFLSLRPGLSLQVAVHVRP